MKIDVGSRDEQLPREQVDRIESFEADYNAIDQYLRRELGGERASSFTSLLGSYFRKHPGWRDKDLLTALADLRNAIVHEKTEPYGYVAVPTPEISRRVHECRERLMSPARVVPTFQRKVQTVSVDDTLGKVLKLIEEKDYSQFPVYANGGFRGLLTENGITRWLAQHVTRILSLVDLDDIEVKQALKNEEKRVNYHFVGRTTRVDDVRSLFASQPLLEGVLITQGGRESEALIGIATRWDMLRYP